jgi:hypothetical protein
MPNYIYISFSGLQDGMQNKWDPELISQVVKDYVTKQKIDTVSSLLVSEL